jgi:nitroimidazol reductase NimA-like FMN-containing flavoprotein (pyridoxamine 5'-phosphate oxidase superfamily)
LVEGLDVLTHDECWDHVREHTVGRVVFSDRALPAIRPLNFTVNGPHILLRPQSRRLAEKLDGQVVAFEVDEIDEVAQLGWSVVVTGTARHVRDPAELTRLDSLAAPSWVGSDPPNTVMITVGDLTGRVITPARSTST